MFIRTWLHVFAFGISLAASTQAWSQTATEDQPRQEDSAADTQAGSENTYPDPIDFSPALKDIEAAIRDLIAEEDKTEADRKKQAESRDLDAQEQMAKWAYWMTLATIGGVVATFVGLGLIGKTLHHTRRAADYTRDMLAEAERATNAAEGGVAATRDIGEKQVRAYLHVTAVKFTLGKNDSEIGVSLTIANAGQSPAVAVKGTVVFEHDGKEPIILDVPLPNIPANSEPTRTIPPAKRDSITSCLKGAKRVTVYVTVTAQDVFDQEITAVSMRTIGISNGAKGGQTYQAEDAEGFFPDKAVEFLAAGYGRFGPNKNKSGPKNKG